MEDLHQVSTLHSLDPEHFIIRIWMISVMHLREVYNICCRQDLIRLKTWQITLQGKISTMVDNLFILTFWGGILQRSRWEFCGFGIWFSYWCVLGFWEVRFMDGLLGLEKLRCKALELLVVLCSEHSLLFSCQWLFFLTHRLLYFFYIYI